MTRALPLLVAIPLIVSFGIGEGYWSNRWGTSREVEQAAARLDGVPLTVGDWEGEAAELDPRQLRLGEIKGSLVRRYVNRRTGAALTVLIVCGRPGPISVHTPDVCYGGAGYGMTDAPIKAPVTPAPAGPAEFWTARFIKTEAASPDPLRINWGWNEGKGWTAAESPRMQFARAPVLFKLYVVRPLSAADESPEKDAGLAFLGQFLPEVERAIFPAS